KKVILLTIKRMFTTIFIVEMILLLQMIQHPNQPPSILGYQGLTVLSNSMNPIYETGDLVLSKTEDPLHVEKGDIITFTPYPSTYVTHRVEDVLDVNGERTFITKGDNKNVADEEPVQAENLVGKVLFHIPYAGYIASFVGSKFGSFLLILLPLVGYIGLYAYDRIGNIKLTKEIKKQ